MTKSQKRAEVTQEYFQLQKTVEDFDARVLTIKAWGITLSMAGVGAAVLKDKPLVALLAASSSLLFWLLEALWKSFQYAYYLRIRVIEQYFANDATSIQPFQVATTWSLSWNLDRRTTFKRIALWPHVFLPHLPTFLVGITTFAYMCLR